MFVELTFLSIKIKVMDSKNSIKITEETGGMRIVRCITQAFPLLPRAKIFAAIRSGEVRVNSKRVTNEYRLVVGESVRLPPQFAKFQNDTESPDNPQEHKSPFKNIAKTIANIKIIYEDADLLIVNKGVGIACHGGSGINLGLIEALREHYNQPKMELAHRLDRETSGVVVIARTRRALRPLHQQFREGEVLKEYYAVVFGVYPKNKTQIDVKLFKHENEDLVKKVVVSTKGLSALTYVELATHNKDFSLLKLKPQTGRTHQLRVHLSYVGHAIVGDNRYADFEQNKDFSRKYHHKRMFLHSAKILIKHPITNEKIEFKAELPPEFYELTTK